MGRQTRCELQTGPRWDFEQEPFFSMEPAFERALRKAGIGGFVRGKEIGVFEIDFFFERAGLAVEVDGALHCMARTVIKDRCKDDFLRSRGITVLRFTNDQVRYDCRECIREVQKALEERTVGMGMVWGEETEAWKRALYEGWRMGKAPSI